MRIALAAAATAGIAAACYDEVPGPSGPLPPTREVPAQGPRPGPISPPPMTVFDGGVPVPVPSPGPSSAHFVGTHARVAVIDPAPDAGAAGVTDAGIDDAVDLPPLPDAGIPLDAPAIAK